MNTPAKNSEALHTQMVNGRPRLEQVFFQPTQDLIVFNQPESQQAVAINKLAGQLILGQSQLAVLAVLSPERREGRSHLIANLGCAIARYGKRVLLIDTDLKASRLHVIFNCQNTFGLADILWKNVFIEPVAPCASLPQLHLMPAGQSHSNFHPGWPIDRLRAWLNKVQNGYDLILLDTPPAIGTFEALATASLADGCLLLARQNMTHYNSAAKLEEDVQRLGIAIVGSILKHF